MSSSNDELEQLRGRIRELPQDEGHHPVIIEASDHDLVCTVADIKALESRLTAAEERERAMREALEYLRDNSAEVIDCRLCDHMQHICGCDELIARVKAALDAAGDAGGATED